VVVHASSADRYFPNTSDIISARVAGLSIKPPRIELVMVITPGFHTPRTPVLHECAASTITPVAPGLQVRQDEVGDILRHALLNLRAVGDRIDHAGQLREADDFTVRQVRDVRLACE